MKKFTIISLDKRFFKLLSIITFIFSSIVAFGFVPISNYNFNLKINNNEFDIGINNNPEIALIKTGVFNDENSNGIAEIGETVSYNFIVTNTGQTVLDDIIVEDPLIAVLGSPISLNPGELDSTSFSATYPITQNDIDKGFVSNQATVTGCYAQEPADPEGNCDGKVTYLKLQYQGAVQNAQIKIVENDGQTIFNSIVQPNEEFQFYGQEGNPPTMGPKINIYINNLFSVEIHTSCSQPIGAGSVFGDFQVIEGASKNGGPLDPVEGFICVSEISDLSDNDNNYQNDPTVVILPGPPPVPRECDCSPFYDNSNFANPQLIAGSALSVGAVYRFANVFPSNPYGTTIDALVRVEQFSGGAGLLDIDVTSSGLQEAFQPRINSTNNNDQSVLFSVTFVNGGGNYGDEVVISFFGTPFDIDGNSDGTREYGEISLPDAYYVSNNTVLDIIQTTTVVRGEAMNTTQAPGGLVSLDPTYTFSNYFENRSSLTYRIGKVDANNDRYYSLDLNSATYDDPNSVLVTYPVICGKVEDVQGNPLANVDIDVTGSDGSSQTVSTDVSGHYKAVAAVPELFVNVDYQIRENDPVGYISISDVDGANDNLISRTVNLASTCGNDFVDGAEPNITVDDKTDILCNGESTGEIKVNATGGMPPYQFSVNGGSLQSSPIFNNLPAGIYNIELLDSLGNTASVSVTLVEPEALSVVITKENATTSQGCQNGEATATVGGGTAPYTYLWSDSAGGQTTETVTNLSEGTHTVTITDVNDCVLVQGVVIDCSNTCDTIVDVNDVTDILCAGDATGSTTVSASSIANSSATFTFTWNTVPAQVDSGVTTSTLNGLIAGIYTVSVTIDGTVCQPVEQSVTLVEPASVLNVSATATDESGPTTGDGTATASVTGGTPPYTYSWSPGGEDTEGITGLSAGDYTVTATDANGCIAEATTTVNPGSCQNLAVTTTVTSATCNGDSDGTATANVTGGSGSFIYLWSPGGETTQTITGLTAGAYTITITDTVTQCNVQTTANVNEPSELTSGIAISNILCFGDETGSLDLTVTGGTFPYTFLWSNGATTEDINDLPAGTYSVDIIDANGCTTSDTATVLQPDAGLEISWSVEDSLCNGESSGAIDITVTGGTAPYFYTWNNGSNSEDLITIGAGIYSVTVIDANGCPLIENNISVSEPEALSVVITKENATTSQGCQNGEATATVGGGTAPYTYLWSASAGGQTTETATNLSEETHTVTITDANDCVLVQGVVIDCSNTCDAIVDVDDVTDILCAGEATGSTTVSASSVANSSATFTFTWNTVPAQVDSGVTTSTLNGLIAGIYTVSVTIDGTVCQPVEQSVTLVEPASVLNVSATATDESGPTTGDGTATASVTGGTPPYTYSWSPGGEDTEGITGLSAGDYTVTATDANGCTAEATTTVNPGSCQNLSVTTTVTSATCNGDSDGTAIANVTGGSGSFTYLWSPGGGTTQTITGLTAGAYTITITDTVTQCNVQTTANVNEPSELTSGIAISNILCFGDETGSLDLTVTGGTFPYTFLWSNGATTEDINDLPAGTYSVDIIDANGCTTSDTATVLQPDAGLEISWSVEDSLCNGESSGAIDITVTGGTAPYFYTWNNGSNSEDLITIGAGIYSVTVIDANGCPLIENNISVSEPEALSVVITKENATTSQGCQNGEATATVGGGTAPYTYLWSASAGGQTTETATNLSEETHTVTITDANDCVLVQGVVIDCSNTCDAIVDVDDVTDILCAGEATGSTTVSASSVANSSATFTFTWNTVPAQVDSGVTTSTLNGLIAGIYTVSVTIDGTVCQPVEQSVTLVEPASVLNVSATATDESGPTTGDGTATASVTGGTPPYTYSWSPGGEDTEGITGLSAGDYTVTATDANGCTAEATTTVNPGSCQNLSVTTTVTSATCNGDSDGTAIANVTGGSGSFTYLWSPGGETTQTITGLTAGAYTITITDTVTQCNVQTTANVNEPSELTSGIAISNILCFGDETGSLDLTVTGGTFPYTFLWSNGATTEDINDLPAGTYSVDIIDANGCTTSDTATVLQPDAGLSSDIASQTDIICDISLGSVLVEVTGGTTPYVFNLDGGTFQNTGLFDDLEAGLYTINIIDSNACEDSVSVTILENCTDSENDINTTFEDTAVTGNVLTNDSDAEGDTQTVTTTTVTTAEGVVVTIDPVTGEYVYTPPAGYVGEDSFEYTVCDDGNPQVCDTATVYIEVLPVGGPENEAPIANADTAGTEEGTPVDGNVLVNDFDPDGDPIVVTTTTVTTTEGVVVTIDPNTGEYTYTPPAGFTGDDSFEYTICDDGNPALCDTAIVVITVTPDNGNTTVANDDAFNTTPGATVSGNVLDNDSDPEGDMQTVNTTPVDDVDNGTLVLNADGTFTYVPNDGFTGTDSFVYSVCDDGTPQACDQATVYITVGGTGNTTDSENDINTTFEDTAVTGNVLTNDSDAEGDTQTVTTTTVTTAEGVVVTIDPVTGEYVYTPPAGYVGEDSFEYTVCDDGNPQVCDTATVYIEVLPVGGPENEAPIANADTAGTEEGTPVDGNVLVNDFDPDGDPIVVTTTTVTTTEGVVVTIDPNTGEYTYTPPAGFTGDDSFEYTICDDGNPALCDTAIVVITVTPDNGNTTVANDDAYLNSTCDSLSGNVLDNDSDPEGDMQTVNTTPVDDVDNGTLVLNADGTFTYVPNDGFTGTDSFVYSVCDDGTPQACDQATVYINVPANGLPEVIDDTSLCAVDETESQVFNLFNLLFGDDFDNTGTWQVISGDATVINNNEFDPTSVELIGENASEEITFSYTLPNSACSVEVTLEVHNRCAVLACGDDDVIVSKVITPNGDMYNEYFEVLGIEDCDYTIDLKIINRWGAIIFESNDYQNNWNGFVLNGSLGSADQIPSGTYYYIVSLINSGLKPISGPVYIGTK